MKRLLELLVYPKKVTKWSIFKLIVSSLPLIAFVIYVIYIIIVSLGNIP